MEALILYAGGIAAIYFIQKSKLSKRTKKILSGLIIIILLLNIIPLVTGKKILPFIFGK